MKTIVAALLMTLTAPAAALADDALLTKLVGEWTGRGTMKVTPDSEPERVFCKITNTLATDGVTLEQKGRCSLSSTSGRIDGSITAKGAGHYAGSLNSLASKGPATLDGRGTASRLELEADFVDTLTGAPSKSVNTIDVLPQGYRLSTSRTNPKDGKSY